MGGFAATTLRAGAEGMSVSVGSSCKLRDRCLLACKVHVVAEAAAVSIRTGACWPCKNVVYGVAEAVADSPGWVLACGLAECTEGRLR